MSALIDYTQKKTSYIPKQANGTKKEIDENLDIGTYNSACSKKGKNSFPSTNFFELIGCFQIGLVGLSLRIFMVI